MLVINLIKLIIIMKITRPNLNYNNKNKVSKLFILTIVNRDNY